jgi:acyl carrier protein
MTATEIRGALERILSRIAPEADLASIDPEEPLQRALDIDSFDFLNLLAGVQKELGVTVAESEYASVATLKGMLQLLASRLAERDS